MKTTKRNKQIKKTVKKGNGQSKKSDKRKRLKSSVKESHVSYRARPTKILDESWDFRKANTKEFTHCFHPYPAMMIPQVARRIIDKISA